MNKEYNFRNNAGEEFKFFLNEKSDIGLNIRFENKLIAAFTLDKKEVEELTNYLISISEKK